MSKLLTPIGQSMASLFTPESQKLSASLKAKAASPSAEKNGMKIPGMGPIKGHKTGDSLGNPGSPGYESWGKKSPETASTAKSQEQGPAGTVIETTAQGPEIVRLSSGWEKLLFAQKKICEKAKAIFTRLDGPPKYSTQKKSKLLSLKSRGCIVDLDVQTTQDEMKAARDREKEREKDSA